MSVPLVWADFNAGGRLGVNREYSLTLLTKKGTWRDLDMQHLQLKEGMKLRMYDCDVDDTGAHDDLVTEGIVHYDAERGEWFAVSEAADMRHVSDVRNDPGHWAGNIDWPAVHRASGLNMDQ